MVIFGITGEPGCFTTDPEIVLGSRQIEKGDYVRLPNGKVYLLESDFPAIFVLVPELEIPADIDVLEAIEFDIS